MNGTKAKNERERDKALETVLYPWRVEELRAIQAEWNRRGVADWTLLDVVSVLISVEHTRMLERAKASGA